MLLLNGKVVKEPELSEISWKFGELTQSLTSQMIGGVFPPGKTPDLNKLARRDGPLKICFECYCAWSNAQKFCNERGFQFYGVDT